MKLCGYFHLFPPEHNAGSETTVHAALRAMVNRGHTVRVVCDRSKTAPYNIDGIEVVRPQRRGVQSWMENYVKDADVLVTHLDLTSQAMTLAMAVKKPLVHFVHNSSQMMYWRVDARVPYKNSLTIYNSNWLANTPSQWGPQILPDEWKSPHSIIVHPVVEPERYRCERGDSITLVNPTAGKGARTFYALAKKMPEYQFLTAQGGYGIQEPCPKGPNTHPFWDEAGNEKPCEGLPNVTHVKNDPDIRNIFRRTKVLLMPSDYESYGRAGVEAACAGIPTIAHPTLGLLEAFGDAGIFLERAEGQDPSGPNEEGVDNAKLSLWETEIKRLMTDEVYYKKRSQMVLDHVAKFDPESEFDRLEEAFIETAERVNGEKPKMFWICDRWIWKMEDGGYRATSDQRIPPCAVALAYGKGSEVPEDIAKANGWLMPGFNKAAPEENKAVMGPEENKGKRRKNAAA